MFGFDFLLNDLNLNVNLAYIMSLIMVEILIKLNEVIAYICQNNCAVKYPRIIKCVEFRVISSVVRSLR